MSLAMSKNRSPPLKAPPLTSTEFCSFGIYSDTSTCGALRPAELGLSVPSAPLIKNRISDKQVVLRVGFEQSDEQCRDRFIHQNHCGQKGRDKGLGTLVQTKMRTEYDFSTKRLKKAVTIRLEPDVIEYFKTMSGENGLPYQNLINLYLMDCAKAGRKLSLAWTK